MIVYHYTSADSLTQIVTSNLLYPSYLNPQMDTAFGEGWYFSNLPPETEDGKLQRALWMKDEPVKSKRYLAFEIDDSLLQRCRPNVYRLRTDLIENGSIDISITYTFTNDQKQAIRFISHGQKQVVYPSYDSNLSNLLGTLSIFALVGIGLYAIAKS